MAHEAQLEPPLGPRREAAAAPPCPNCGYDLAGLELPHRCPECGLEYDHDKLVQAAQRWFRSWRGLLFWRPPPRVALYLNDPASRRRGKRRVLFGAVVPAMVLSTALLAANAIVVSEKLEFWWEAAQRPGVRQDVWQRDYASRVLRLEPETLGFAVFDNAVPMRVLSRQLHWEWTRPHGSALVIVILPALVLTMLPALLVVLLTMRRFARALDNSTIPVWPLLAAPVAPILCALTCVLFATTLAVTASVLDENALIQWNSLFGPVTRIWVGRTLAIGYCASVLAAGVAGVQAVGATRPRLRGLPFGVPAAICVASLAAAVSVALTPLVMWVARTYTPQ